MATEYQMKWDDWYRLAEKYYEEHGSLLVPHNYITDDGHKLGGWINRQRLLYKNKRRTQLAQIQIDKLNKIEMVWNSHAERWNENYHAAKEFYINNGHLNIPSDYKSKNGIRLAMWISAQRKHYKDDQLSDAQIFKLEQIHMNWNLIDAQWMKMYAAAKDYYEQHGNLKVPVSYVTESGAKLSNWIRRQRYSYRGINGNLSAAQIALLNDIGMIWDVSANKKWNDNYREAKKFYQKNGHLLVLNNYTSKNGFALGKWVDIQRKKYTNGELDSDKIEKLNDIGMIWESNNVSKWERNYGLAKSFYQENGHLNITQRYTTDEGIRLGLWLLNQKDKKRDNKLEAEKIKRLDDIGITWHQEK